MIERILVKKIKQSLQSFPIVGVIGPRQSGKTTLVKNLLPDWVYVSLENPDTRAFAQNDPREFLQKYQENVIFDEIQRVPELFSYLQEQVDLRDRSGQFVITGSQHFLLMQHLSQSLAGRIALCTLLPLSIEELKASTLLPHFLVNTIFAGMYPRVYSHEVNTHDWYNNYIQTYIERDVRLVKNISDLSLFQKFLKLCAGRTGQLLQVASLANDCGISHYTAKSWLAILEASFIIFLLQPHVRNFNKRLIKSPKLYFIDTGVACALLGITKSDQIESHPLKGALFENFIVAELLKDRLHHGLKPNLFFWRDKIGHEIDVIIETPERLVPVEIKAGSTITTDYFRHLKYWTTLAQADPRAAFVVYAGAEQQQRTAGTVLPWQAVNTISGIGSN